MQLKQITLFLTILFFHQSLFAALTPEEIACNQAIEKGDAADALVKANGLLKSDQNNTSALICKGNALRMQDKSQEAIKAFDQAELTAKDNYDKAVASFKAGTTYKNIQQNSDAISRYEKAMAYAKLAKNNTLMMIAQMQIGDIQYDSSQYKPALESYLAASKLASNDLERGENDEKIAQTYYVLNQYDQALAYEVQAQLMMEKAGSLDQYAHATVQLGNYYFLNKNYSSAEDVLNKIINFAKERGGLYYEAQASYVLAKVKAQKNDKEAAKSLVAHAKEIAQSTQDQALAEEIDRETKGLF